MTKDIGYFINIPDGKLDDTAAFIKAALDHDLILKWAYILQDKEYYNEFDLSSRRCGLQYNWADGFPGMEKYASVDEYIQEKMSGPPFIGDKKPSHWRIVCIVDKKCMMKDISEWFGLPGSPYADFLENRVQIVGRLKYLTHEDEHSRIEGAHLYPDEEVISNFDFRTYINETKVNPRLEQIKKFFRPAPLKKDLRRYY